MRKLTTILFLMLVAAFTAPAQTRERAILDEQALRRVAAQETPRVRRMTDSLDAFKRAAGLGAEFSFRKGRVYTDQYGDTHVRFAQFYNGVPILGSTVITHMNADGEIEEPTDKSFPGMRISTHPAIGADEARTRIAAIYQRTMAGVIVEPSVDLQLMVVPDERPWLAYRAEVSARDRNGDVAEPKGYLMNANTGDIARTFELSVDDLPIQIAPDDKSTGYGTVQLNTTWLPAEKQYELKDPTRSNATVLNLNFGGIGQTNVATKFKDTDDRWGDGVDFNYATETDYGSQHGQTRAVSAAFAIGNSYDMLKNVFNYRSIDGNGAKPITAYVHTSTTDSNGLRVVYTDARWSGGAAWFGGLGIDKVGHELGHGVFFEQLETVSGGEAGGLNEGHGDIMGSLAEFYLLANKRAGSSFIDVNASWNFRDRMINPTNYAWSGDQGRAYYENGMGSLEVHAQGCAYGRAWVFLARGSSGDPNEPLYSNKFPLGMSGIGVDKAARIWFRATTAHLPADPTFLDTRKAYERAAADLYGMNSAERLAVQRAFHAINVGPAPVIIVNP